MLTASTELVAEVAGLVVISIGYTQVWKHVNEKRTSFHPVMDSCAICRVGLVNTGLQSLMKDNEPRASKSLPLTADWIYGMLFSRFITEKFSKLVQHIEQRPTLSLMATHEL